jgi:thymidylate synthase ThyX
MTYSAKILSDSISKYNHRFITYEIVLPRIVLAELNTHKILSKNSASSRAIPVEKMIKKVLEDPYIPSHWGKNQRGMQAEFKVNIFTAWRSKKEWLKARDNAVDSANKLLKFGIHKQITNRLLEPFMWHTVIISGTEWDNFFSQRCHKDAHPDIKETAQLMRDLYNESIPIELNENQWHCPLIQDDEWHLSYELLKKISAGRCARVSYLNHDGKRDIKADIELGERMVKSGHCSPFEHIARPMDDDEIINYSRFKKIPDKEWIEEGPFCGPLKGWVQYRKEFLHEENLLAYTNN